jgi:hypothetical protein
MNEETQMKHLPCDWGNVRKKLLKRLDDKRSKQFTPRPKFPKSWNYNK